MPFSFDFDFNRLGALIVVYGVNCLGAVLIAVAGWWIAGAFERAARRALLSTSRMDVTVAGFLASLVRYATLAITLVLILQVVGVQATSLVAVIGASSLAIGLALQGTLSNMAAGVMLLIFRPFKLGDAIEVAGKSGAVQNLNLFFTELAAGDNVQVLIPNGQVWGQALVNNSAYATRKLMLKLVVGLDKDYEAIAERLRAFLAADARVQQSPPPAVIASGVTAGGVELTVEAWARTQEVGALRLDINRQIFLALKTPAAL